jgi:hypothetical protein
MHQKQMHTLEINLFESVLVKDLHKATTVDDAIKFLHCMLKIKHASSFSFKYNPRNKEESLTWLEESFCFHKIIGTVKKHNQQLYDKYYTLYPKESS